MFMWCWRCGRALWELKEAVVGFGFCTLLLAVILYGIFATPYSPGTIGFIFAIFAICAGWSAAAALMRGDADTEFEESLLKRRLLMCGALLAFWPLSIVFLPQWLAFVGVVVGLVLQWVPLVGIYLRCRDVVTGAAMREPA